jgi:hypothetical protein
MKVIAKVVLIYAAVVAMLLPAIYFSLRFIRRERGGAPFILWAKASAWFGIVAFSLMLVLFTFAVGGTLFLNMTGQLHR